MTEPLWLAFATLGATVVTMIGQLVFLVLRRRWETQDREEKAALAVKVEENRIVIAAKVDEAAQGVAEKVAENTAVNAEAIRVANNFSVRLEASNNRWEEFLSANVSDPVTQIRSKVEDIHHVVVEGNGESAGTA